MKITELPEDFKQYRLILSNGSEYIVSGKTKKNILLSRANFVELKNGTTINKSFIIEFKLDINLTKDFVNKNKNKIIKI